MAERFFYKSAPSALAAAKRLYRQTGVPQVVWARRNPFDKFYILSFFEEPKLPTDFYPLGIITSRNLEYTRQGLPHICSKCVVYSAYYAIIQGKCKKARIWLSYEAEAMWLDVRRQPVTDRWIKSVEVSRNGIKTTEKLEELANANTQECRRILSSVN